METNDEKEKMIKEDQEIDDKMPLMANNYSGGVNYEPLPTNIYSLIGLIIRILGNQAVPILVVTGLVVAVYAFYQKDAERDRAVEKARTETEKVFQDRLKKANEMADNAYVKIAELSRKQIDTVDNLMKMQKKAADFLDIQRIKTEEVRKQAEVEINRASTAKKDAELKINDAKKSINIAQGLKREVEDLVKKNTDKERRLKEETDRLNKRVKEIQELKEKYIALAKATLKLPTGLLDNEKLNQTEAYKLSKNARKEYFPKNVESPVSGWLSDYAENPGNHTAQALEKLIGVRNDQLESFLRQGLGFKSWVKLMIRPATEKGFKSISKDQILVYFGIQEMTEYSYKNFITITMGGKTENGKEIFQVSNIDFQKSTAFMKIRDTENWNDHSYYEISEDEGEDTSINISKLDGTFNGDDWNIFKFIETFNWRDTTLVWDEIFGKPKDVMIMSYSEAKIKYPQISQEVLERGDHELADALNMVKNANLFSPPQENKSIIDKMPSGLKETFDRLLTASVKMETKDARSLMDLSIKSKTLGQIAALALKPEFHVVRIQGIFPNMAGTDIFAMVQHQQVQAANRISQTFEESLVGYYVFVDYRNSLFDEEIRVVRFDFWVAETETGWILKDVKMIDDRSSSDSYLK